MSKKAGFIIIASLVVVIGFYQTAQTEVEDDQKVYRENCVDDEDCG